MHVFQLSAADSELESLRCRLAERTAELESLRSRLAAEKAGGGGGQVRRSRQQVSGENCER